MHEYNSRNHLMKRKKLFGQPNIYIYSSIYFYCIYVSTMYTCYTILFRGHYHLYCALEKLLSRAMFEK